MAADRLSSSHKDLDGFLEDLGNKWATTKSRSEQDRMQQIDDHMREHRDKIDIVKTPPSYNYVVFNPQLIELVAKRDAKGNIIKDYSQGIKLKPVDHDPFAEEHK